MRALTLLLLALILTGAPLLADSLQAELTLEHDSGLVTAAWNSGETQILTATEGGLVHVWSAADGEKLATIDHEGKPLTHALWIGAGGMILSADESGEARLSASDDGGTIHSWRLAGKPVALEATADAERALLFTDVGGAILSLSDGALLAEFAAAPKIRGAALSADESRLRAWSEDGSVLSWHLASGEAQETRPPHRGLLQGLRWNADDSRVLAWFADGLVNLYESDGVSIGRGRVSGVRHDSFVQGALWSRDESRVMSWAGDDSLRVWAAESGRALRVYRHEDWVIGAVWDPDEERALSWSHIYVYIWDSEGRARRFRHDNLARGAVWNGAATRVLSWSWDGTARVWNAGAA